jgi:hypothetical protein
MGSMGCHSSRISYYKLRIIRIQLSDNPYPSDIVNTKSAFASAHHRIRIIHIHMDIKNSSLNSHNSDSDRNGFIPTGVRARRDPAPPLSKARRRAMWLPGSSPRSSLGPAGASQAAGICPEELSHCRRDPPGGARRDSPLHFEAIGILHGGPLPPARVAGSPPGGSSGAAVAGDSFWRSTSGRRDLAWRSSPEIQERKEK